MILRYFLFAAVLLACTKQEAPKLEVPRPVGKKVVFLGDSLTEGYGIASDKTFPSLIQSELAKRGKSIDVMNASISGSTSASAKSRMLWVLRGKPDIIVLALGANDGLRGLSTQALYKNLEEAIDLALNQKVTVVLAGMRMSPNLGKAYVQEFDETYRKLAEKKKIPLIPFLLEGVAGDIELNQADGIHPNEKGHERMKDTVLRYLEPLV